jgi:hypothetical protein
VWCVVLILVNVCCVLDRFQNVIFFLSLEKKRIFVKNSFSMISSDVIEYSG